MSLVEGDEVEKEPLGDAVTHILEECRMVLPGVQTLFGFQLIAVFNQTFDAKLSEREQQAHLVAIGMTTVAIALLMGPAAYHRQVHPESVSRAHLRISSWYLTFGMLPLMLALAIDFYLVARVIVNDVMVAGLATAGVLAVLTTIWVVIPRVKRYQRRGRVL